MRSVFDNFVPALNFFPVFKFLLIFSFQQQTIMNMIVNKKKFFTIYKSISIQNKLVEKKIEEMHPSKKEE